MRPVATRQSEGEVNGYAAKMPKAAGLRIADKVACVILRTLIISAQYACDVCHALLTEVYKF